MVVRTGESMDALSWKATAAVISTPMSRAMPPLRESTGSAVGAPWEELTAVAPFCVAPLGREEPFGESFVVKINPLGKLGRV